MGAASFAAENARRIKEYNERMAMSGTVATGDIPQYDRTEDPGLKAKKLNQMNKDDLKAYAQTIGLHLDLEMTKIQMIELIQQRETEMA